MEQAVSPLRPSWQTQGSVPPAMACGTGSYGSIQSKGNVRGVEAREVTSEVMRAHLTAVADLRDRTAFAALFRHFAPRLKAYILRLGADPAAAEDLMQETMVLVWRKAEQFDPGRSSPSTWIFTIARNIRIDAYRKEKRPELDPNDPALVPDADPGADTMLHDRQSATRLKAAIAGLSRNEQDLLRHA
jgi:RNA polymerase sigma-70 factor (ECF subfamily)